MSVIGKMRRRIPEGPHRMLDCVGSDPAKGSFTFKCRTCGHQWTDRYVFPNGLKFSPQATERMAHWWSKDYAGGRGCSGQCPSCTKEWNEARKARRQGPPPPRRIGR